MFFKTYSIIVIFVAGLVLYYSRTTITLLWWLILMIPCSAMYLYGSRKVVFTTPVWKRLFYFYVIFSFIYEIIRPLVYQKALIDASFLIAILIMLSLWIGLYFYAFRFMSQKLK